VAKKRNGERGGGGGIAGHTDMNGVFWRVKKAYNSGGMITASGNSLVWSGEGWGEAWRGGGSTYQLIVTYLAYRLHLKL
jgi:hypothetical protein